MQQQKVQSIDNSEIERFKRENERIKQELENKKIEDENKKKQAEIERLKKEQEELKRQKEQTASSSGKWLDPTQSACESGGGEWVNAREYNGKEWVGTTKKVCKANWEDANSICSKSGGRLPNIEELKAVVKECGGENVTFGDTNWESITDRNKANQK